MPMRNPQTKVGTVFRLACETCLFLSFISWCNAAEITWTNIGGGNWSAPLNWSPNHVPSSADAATITNAGTYTVNLDVNATINGLRVGGTSGAQTLVINGPGLTNNGPGLIGSNGFASVFTGSLAGTGNLSVDGVLNLFGGNLDGTGALTVSPAGQVTLNGNL